MAVWIRIVLGLAALKIVFGLAAGLIDPLAPDTGAPFGVWVALAVSIAFAAVGVLLVWSGDLDSRAVHLGIVFVLVAALFAERPLVRFAAHPGAAGALFTALSIADPVAFRPYFFWRFAAAFPRRIEFGWPRRVTSIALGWTRAAGWVFFLSSLVAAAAATAGHPIGHPWFLALDRQAGAPLYWFFLTPFTLAALLIIAVNTRAANALERRRVRVFVVGLLVGTGPVLLEVLVELLVPAFAAYMSQPRVRTSVGLVVYPLLISTPISAGYAVLVDQVLSVRLVLRAALRYALARATIIALSAVPFVLLVGLAWSTRSGSGTLPAGGGRVLLLGALLAGGLGLLLVRHSLLLAIDRQFFREQYDARTILGSLVHQCRQARSVQDLAAHLSREIDRALHVDAVVLMVRGAGTLVPIGAGGESLADDASVVKLLAGSPDPMDVNLDQPKSTLARLPERERQWLADGGFRLLVPMLGADGPLVGFIAIGGKKSELPFSREDRWLLATIAGSCALAIENLQLRTPDPLAARTGQRDVTSGGVLEAEAPARECDSCGSVFPPQAARCGTCLRDLRESPVPLVVRGTYRIERLLGRGGMGVVYRGTDLSLGRTVAIKTLPAVSPEHALKLRREAKAMAAVAHPGLATIYAIEFWRGTPLLIVECLEQTLHDRLRAGPLRPDEAVRMGIDLAGGLEALHVAGILHRDVKPSNIGFAADGTPKLLDFGLATVVRKTAAGDRSAAPSSQTTRISDPPTDELEVSSSTPLRIVGTPLYVSPETVRLKPPDAGVDLWALAVVLYESVAGTHPLRGATALETMMRIARADAPDVRTYRPNCPPALAAFLSRALHPDPRRRPGTAREFRVQLQESVPMALAS